MEYIFIILLQLILIILIIIFVFNKPKSIPRKLSIELKHLEDITIRQSQILQANLIEKLVNTQNNQLKDLIQFKEQLTKSINEDFNQLNNLTERRLLKINEQVNLSLEKGFEKTNIAFNNMIERISRIDEAQKKLNELSTDIVSLQTVLTDKKTRGIFGEVQLNNLLVSVFGEKQTIYHIQYKMSSGVIVDALINAPDPLGKIAIDSKFPLENYRKMIDKTINEEIRTKFTKEFKSDVKKHIDAIANKYIIIGETANQAIMFLPAEAIFAEINAYHEDLITYAQKQNVWIVSPTTLMSTLTTLQILIRNIERDAYAKEIHNELEKLGVEFSRFRERWGQLSNSIDTVNKKVKDFDITTSKIEKRFDALSKVQINDNNINENINNNFINSD